MTSSKRHLAEDLIEHSFDDGVRAGWHFQQCGDSAQIGTIVENRLNMVVYRAAGDYPCTGSGGASS